MRKITKAYQIIRHYGLGVCTFRAQYGLRKKLGLLRRKFPIRSWSEITLGDWLKPQVDHRPEAFLQAHQSNGRRFFFDSSNLPTLENYKEKIVLQADEVLKNRFKYFFDKNYDLGPGPDWFLNPATGKRAKPDFHWCDIDLFDPDVGDIKFIWEVSRFGWVYTLARAYSATGRQKYAEKFWSLFESWLKANPPNMGPNYACGQECAIRLMAMCFAFYALANATASTVERKIKLIATIAFHAERIEKNIDFAISTQTNHSLTESAGLYTVGLLFPEFEYSENWAKLGKKVLTNEGLKQIYPDGSYIQHSMNYHRLMLQDFLYVLRLAQLNNDSFSVELKQQVQKAGCFLFDMQDEVTGGVPNYGANDGSLIISLNSCDYLDHRPVLQAVHYLFNKTRLYESGTYEEDLVWFFGPEALTAPLEQIKRVSMKYVSGGYYTLRNGGNWAMMRCHSYSDRPSHADMLHLDLWWKGVNILRDSGSYMYNCDEPWQSYFASTAAHNAVTIDGANQMTKASRFLWLDWVRAKLVEHKSFEGGAFKIMQGEHYGYSRRSTNIIHRRAVLSWGGLYWLIIDDVLGTGIHQTILNWQLCNCDYKLKDSTLLLQTSEGTASLAILDSAGRGKCECFAGDDWPRGWQSLYYGNRQAAPMLVYSQRAILPVRIVTILSLGDTIRDASLTRTAGIVTWTSEVSGQKRVVALNPIDNSERNTFVFAQQGFEMTFLD